MFDMPGPSQGNNLSRLYGSTATQYINEMLLQGNTPPKFPASPIPDGKKPLVGKHSDGSGKPWQFQQVRDENVRRLNYNIKTNKQTNKQRDMLSFDKGLNIETSAVETLDSGHYALCTIN